MTRQRFLRDNTLDTMLQEIQAIAENLSSQQFPGLVFSKSLESLSEMYETNKMVLGHLEQAIDHLRRQEPKNDQALEAIVSAASHVQIGLVSIHQSLKEDVGMLLEQISQLKSSLGLDEEVK